MTELILSPSHMLGIVRPVAVTLEQTWNPTVVLMVGPLETLR